MIASIWNDICLLWHDIWKLILSDSFGNLMSIVIFLSGVFFVRKWLFRRNLDKRYDIAYDFLDKFFLFPNRYLILCNERVMYGFLIKKIIDNNEVINCKHDILIGCMQLISKFDILMWDVFFYFERLSQYEVIINPDLYPEVKKVVDEFSIVLTERSVVLREFAASIKKSTSHDEIISAYKNYQGKFADDHLNHLKRIEDIYLIFNELIKIKHDKYFSFPVKRLSDVRVRM